MRKRENRNERDERGRHFIILPPKTEGLGTTTIV
jgi:hypothetical protein